MLAVLRNREAGGPAARPDGGAAMNSTAAQIFWWVALPYLALGVFVDRFGWTSYSTQLQERRMLKWGVPLFHYVRSPPSGC